MRSRLFEVTTRDNKWARSSSATAQSSGSSLNGSRGRKPTAPLLTWASIPARWPLSSSRWTKTGRTFLTDELKDELKLWARIKESTVKRLWLLLWRPELMDVLMTTKKLLIYYFRVET